MKVVVITGASSGIGYKSCELFAQKGYHVFGSVRSTKDAEKLNIRLKENFTPLIFDITDMAATSRAAKIVAKFLKGQTLSALINNAGIAVMGPLEFMPVSEFQKQINTNVVGTLNCIKSFLPLLKPKSPDATLPAGRIINISSALGGKIGYPFYGAYCASKHAIEGLSEALRRELGLHGIKVVVVAPGAIATPIWNKAEKKFVEQDYSNTIYASAFKKNMESLKSLGVNGMPPISVAQKILIAVETKRPKARYYFFSELALNLLYYTPNRLLDYFIARQLGLTEKKTIN